ncbi:MAG: sigma-70 family RNA polymerase sigma factor [Vicinamibacterales bacterium]
MAQSRRDEFDAVALVHLDELYRVARRVTLDATEAEDLVQETYLRGWQGFGRFERGTNCRAWLYKILFRTIGARRRELLRELALFDQEPFDEDGVVPSRDVEPVLTADQLRRAFESLPVAFCVAIHLVDVEGLSYREAADAMEVPVGTVMSRLHRGRSLLRRHFAPSPALLSAMRRRS